MPTPTTHLSPNASAVSERSPLLGANKKRRESVVEYATHVPEDYAPVLDTQKEIKHYNLAGLSTTDFWLLVGRWCEVGLTGSVSRCGLAPSSARSMALLVSSVLSYLLT